MITIKLQVMFTNRKEKAELLEALVVSNKDPTIPNFPQVFQLPPFLSSHIYSYRVSSSENDML